MRGRVRWHDRRNGSFSGSALLLVRRSGGLLHRRPWIGLGGESGRSRDGQKVSAWRDRKSTRLNSSHLGISYAVFCLKKQRTHSLTFSHSGHSFAVFLFETTAG